MPNLIKKNPYLRGFFLYFILFLIAFCFFFFLQSDAKLADPDSFYHAKMALLLKEQGIFKTFPWLQFSVLKDNYADHHFLYHVLLIPLVSFLHPLWAVKLTAIVLASSLILLIYYFLRTLKVKGAFFYALFLLGISPFVFRISLAKAPVLSIIVLLLAFLALIKKKNIWLFVLSFIYVWLYGGWPLILVLTGTYCLVESIKAKKIFTQANWQRLLAVISGLAAGLVINPYFPENIKFYWYQTFEIGFVNYASQIGVGVEWLPYALNYLIADTIFLSLLALLAFGSFIFNFKKQKTETWVAFLMFVAFFILTLKARRQIEYLAPFALIYSALVINSSFNSRFLKRIKEEARGIFASHIFWAYIASFLLASFVMIFCLDAKRVRHVLNDGFVFDKWQGASEFLLKNSLPQEIVFTSDWDEFPILFYHNSKNYYITGLDPTFMYLYDQGLHQKYVDITTGKQNSGLYSIIKEEFKASYVFIDDSHKKMLENIAADQGFKKVYSSSEAAIFEL